MAEIIRMPLLSDTMEEGTIVAWNKKVGDTVEAGDILAEVETDKAVMEVESYFDGVLLYIGVEEGSSVPIDGIIAVIGEEGEDFQAQLDAADSDTGTKPESTPEEAVEEKKTPEVDKAPAESTPTPEPATAGGDKRLKASPLARKMAEEEGVDISKVSGSGDGGRVIKRDIIAYLESGAQKEQPAGDASGAEEKPYVPAFSMSAEESFEDVNISQMRKTIARRLGESKFSAPHFYLTVDVDMKHAIEARKRMNEVAPVKISFNDLVIKACAVALHKHPAVNAAWLGDKIRYNKHVHVGVAVAVEEGLLVPVVRHADLKTLAQLNSEVRELAGKAKQRKLSMDEMTGNTFTISNLGMFGIEEFTAIINPPDSCILAVGTIVEKPVVENGQIVVGHRMKITLSCDHRVVDGAKGAQFLKTVKENLEQPVRLLI